MRCPGQNTQFWKSEDIKEAQCPICGTAVEFWKDDAKRICSRCGHDFQNPGKDRGCAMWCKTAKECLNLSPEEWKALQLKQQEGKDAFERMMKVMKTKTVRQIIRIDEEKCTGCGECIPSCAEGALTIVNGKARLVTEKYCDGLGACLSECPFGALSIEERAADEFDEEAVAEHMNKSDAKECAHSGTAPAFSGCPSARTMIFEKPSETRLETGSARGASHLGSWPVQIHLMNPSNPIFNGANLLVVSDCVPLAYRYFHEDFLNGKVPLMGCPKLDDGEQYIAKLAELFKRNDVKSVTVARMEVPCCSGMKRVVREAISASGKDISIEEAVISVTGERR